METAASRLALNITCILNHNEYSQAVHYHVLYYYYYYYYYYHYSYRFFLHRHNHNYSMTQQLKLKTTTTFTYLHTNITTHPTFNGECWYLSKSENNVSRRQYWSCWQCLIILLSTKRLKVFELNSCIGKSTNVHPFLHVLFLGHEFWCHVVAHSDRRNGH